MNPPSQPKPQDFCAQGLAVIDIEQQALQALRTRIDQHFARACELLLDCQGRVVVIGVGKSGHIGRKCAATLASTGTPAFFVHPSEASHGDMGMITRQDIVLAISNSGNAHEIVALLPLIQRLNVPLITLTGDHQSKMAQAATINLDVSVNEEACPLGLAPTASTTAALAMSDALAIALLSARGFTKEAFALSHPGGQLGKRLLLRVQDLMHAGEDLPCVTANTLVRDAIVEMSAKGLGCVLVTNANQQLQGIFTDGDLRRAFEKNITLNDAMITDHMTKNCKTLPPDTLAFDAKELMRTHQITGIVIVDDEQIIQGLVHIHDLFRAGIA